MRDVDMTVVADDTVQLAGTLTLPTGPGPHPAVLLLHGSGPLDRDGNTPKLRVDLGPPLAEALAAEGIAVLRYDRRGAGATPGDWRATGFVDNRLDAAAAVRVLAAHPDIMQDAIGVVGHSEGAVHAMSLASSVCLGAPGTPGTAGARGTGPDIKAVVLLAGFASTGETAFRWQARSVTRSLPAPARLLLTSLRAVGERQLARIKRTTTDVARIAGLPLNARWTREMLRHDAREDLAAIRIPVLAVTGDRDIQVNPGDLDEIRRLVPGGAAEVHRFPDLTHLLRRDSSSGPPSMRSYRRQLREPVDPGLLGQVVDWLGRQLPERAGEVRSTEHRASS